MKPVSKSQLAAWNKKLTRRWIRDCGIVPPPTAPPSSSSTPQLIIVFKVNRLIKLRFYVTVNCPTFCEAVFIGVYTSWKQNLEIYHFNKVTFKVPPLFHQMCLQHMFNVSPIRLKSKYTLLWYYDGVVKLVYLALWHLIIELCPPVHQSNTSTNVPTPTNCWTWTLWEKLCRKNAQKLILQVFHCHKDLRL